MDNVLTKPDLAIGPIAVAALSETPAWMWLPYVYVAGPLTLGGEANNIRVAIEAANQVIDLNCIPYLPHLTWFWHLVTPRSYAQWLFLDKRWLAQCDVMLRLPGESKGADEEEAFAKEAGIPVVYGLSELKQWLETMWSDPSDDG